VDRRAHEPERLAVGAMTGTSIDGIDAVLVALRGRGLAMRASIRARVSRSLGPLADRLRAIAAGMKAPAGEIARAARELGELHADVIAEIVDPHRPPDFISVHGQTIFHVPPLSWQLIDPDPIAARLRAPVVTGLRRADLAAGGQGAPITPLADWILLRGPEPRAIVNLGGFVNVTLLPAEDHPDPRGAIRGRDVCACNHILDEIAREAMGRAYDDGGACALRGGIDEQRAAELAVSLDANVGAARSLGTGDESVAGVWIERGRAAVRAGQLDAADLAATAAATIGRVVAAHTASCAVYLAGGGARNEALVAAIAAAAAAPVRHTDALGVAGGDREAAAMAILGALAQDGEPITLPQVTGRGAMTLATGTWVRPGNGDSYHFPS
jgi:1,6-anhydro-N-acetylmuramate kinase